MPQRLQKQHRVSERAPHGKPKFPDKVGCRCTTEQREEYAKRGGGTWMRNALNYAIKHNLKF